MTKELKAIYEDGVFKPLEPVNLDEHQEVVLFFNSVNGDKELPTNGTELIEYWRKEGVIGSLPEDVDSLERARTLRREAETRKHQ